METILKNNSQKKLGNIEKEENKIIFMKLQVLFQELEVTALTWPEDLLIYCLLHSLHWGDSKVISYAHLSQ